MKVYNAFGIDKISKYLQQGRQFQSSLLSSAGYIPLLIGLAFLLSACAGIFSAPAQSGGAAPSVTPTAVTPATIVSPTPTPKPFTLQVVNCPSFSINWDHLIGTRTNIDQVQKVACGPLEGGNLAALVNVRYYASDAKLDIYVYDNLTGTPARRFALPGLVQGDAQIGPTNTIITAQNASNDPLGADLFKDYQWNGTTFTQISFPGIYPDATYYQAEQSQALASSQNSNVALSNAWRTSAYPVLHKLAADLFHWTQITDHIVTYNPSTATYIIQESNQGPGGGGFVAQLFRLDNVPGNIFEVLHVTAIDGVTQIASPTSGAQISSPVAVIGSTLSSGSILGQVVLYDDTYKIVGESGAIHAPLSSGYVSFNQSVRFQLNSRGLQEGVVAFYSTNQNNIAFNNQVTLVKVFFSA